MIEQLGEDPISVESSKPRRPAERCRGQRVARARRHHQLDRRDPQPSADFRRQVWTDRDSRAEIDIGDAVIRLGSTTGFSFLNLDVQTAQMQVTAGTIIVQVGSLASGEQDEIDTPNRRPDIGAAGHLSGRGERQRRYDRREGRRGRGARERRRQSYPVAAQQSVILQRARARSPPSTQPSARPDSLDQWSLQRDQQEQQQAAVAQDYVPPDTVGGDDLGSYGSWEDTPDWGYAWFPTVAADWAPYSLGYWVWISPWGWTWVDDEPWGFAPFHYGRWGYWGHRWCWVPGPRGVRPVYAPALVAWVGARVHGSRRRPGSYRLAAARSGRRLCGAAQSPTPAMSTAQFRAP